MKGRIAATVRRVDSIALSKLEMYQGKRCCCGRKPAWVVHCVPYRPAACRESERLYV